MIVGLLLGLLAAGALCWLQTPGSDLSSLPGARRVRVHWPISNGHALRLDSAGFIDSRRSYLAYFQLLDQFSNDPQLQEVRYDYYDWSNTFYRMHNRLLHVCRYQHFLLVIESREAISLDEFQQISVGWISQRYRQR